MNPRLKTALLYAVSGLGGAAFIGGVFPLIYLAACRAAEKAPQAQTASFLCIALCVGTGAVYLYAALQLNRLAVKCGHAVLFGGTVAAVLWLWLFRRLDLMNPERLWERAVERLGPAAPGEINDLARAYARPFAVLIIALLVLTVFWLMDMVLVLFARYRRAILEEEARIAEEDDEYDDDEDEYEDEYEDEEDDDEDEYEDEQEDGEEEIDADGADDGEKADP